MVRINKYLAACNLGSRRQVENLIRNGKVKVNGNICRDLACQINPNQDIVQYLGKKLSLPSDKIYIMMNKPRNYLVSTIDSRNRKTVFLLLPDLGLHLFPVGRLDYQSEGLLLLTNDGDFANRIIHPRHEIPKVYKVITSRSLSREELQSLRKGIILAGTRTLPAIVYQKRTKTGGTYLRMTIFEGKKRQIRRMLQTLGIDVLILKRLQLGNLKLGNLPIGMWRFMTQSEIKTLLNLTFNQG